MEMMMQVTTSEDQSPKLKALQEAVGVGDGDALDAFWQEVAHRGAPLIQTDESDPRYSLVTFLWRANERVENVVVFGNWSTFDLADLQMLRLGDADGLLALQELGEVGEAGMKNV